jgi:hypothetical protein
MTHFRFRYKRVGYMRWRCRTARVRAMVLVLPTAAGGCHAPSAAAWRRTQPVVVAPTPIGHVLQVGGYVVGEEGDSRLSGHPDIRY